MLTNVEFDIFTLVIENLKTPSGHVSTLANTLGRKHLGVLSPMITMY
jgi:hypothetical protein